MVDWFRTFVSMQTSDEVSNGSPVHSLCSPHPSSQTATEVCVCVCIALRGFSILFIHSLAARPHSWLNARRPEMRRVCMRLCCLALYVLHPLSHSLHARFSRVCSESATSTVERKLRSDAQRNEPPPLLIRKMTGWMGRMYGPSCSMRKPRLAHCCPST